MTVPRTETDSLSAHGAALAAFLAAGIGAFATGLFVILHEAGIFSAPAFYKPAGGLSGRTTLAVAVWLIAWAALHHRWKDRSLSAARVQLWTVVLIALGLIMTFPPVWAVF